MRPGDRARERTHAKGAGGGEGGLEEAEEKSRRTLTAPPTATLPVITSSRMAGLARGIHARLQKASERFESREIERGGSLRG